MIILENVHEMFKMFIGQGQSGSHLLKKPGWGLPDSG